VFAILTATGFVAATEVGYISGSHAQLVILGMLASSLVFSIARRREPVARDYPGQDVIEAKLSGVKLSGDRLPERLLNDRIILVLLLCAIAWFMQYHHGSTQELLQKNLEATAENTYVLSLSQPERESLRIIMPESLKRKIRERS
jgi:hypothetical protein